MKSAFVAIALASTFSFTHAAIVNIDLSCAVTGTVVTGVGATFAQTFAGQTVAGAGIIGSPSNPLMLSPAGQITVAVYRFYSVR